MRTAEIGQKQTQLDRVFISISAGVTHAACMKIFTTRGSGVMGTGINAAKDENLAAELDIYPDA